MASKRVRAVVTGRVQGVWYRGSTQERARELGLTGWVRNMPDGTVELEAQGAPGDVEALLDWCRSGPPAARVERVSASEIDAQEGERAFEVRH